MIRLLQASSILDKILNHLPVHQRLPAEEVHLQIHTVTGVGNKKIQCLLSDFKAHQCPSSMIFALFCKTVTAGEVTVMCNMKAECFHNCLTLLKIKNIILINVRCKQLSKLL